MAGIQLIQFILGIAILILLHEFGHFAAAKLLKVDVEEFGIGFPPRLLKLFEYKGTLYSINLLPLGGFVRPKGENDPTVEGGLAAASPWTRLTVLFAGPIMNIVVGILLGIILFYSLGNPIADQVMVDFTEAGTPAELAGMQAGDIFVSVNGENVDDSIELQELINANLGIPTTFIIDRNGQEISIVLTPRAEYPEGQGPIGVGITNPTEPVSIFTAIERGFQATLEYAKALFALPVRLVTGEASAEEGRLLGYKGMYDIFRYLRSPLYFFMVISISLGIINLLPIPALDGGRILLILPEIFLHRRIPPQYENMIHAVGFMLLILVMIYINLQDFINPLELP
jgi:regulator of sigma E protease